jgi:hypothetical protein
MQQAQKLSSGEVLLYGNGQSLLTPFIHKGIFFAVAALARPTHTHTRVTTLAFHVATMSVMHA